MACCRRVGVTERMTMRIIESGSVKFKLLALAAFLLSAVAATLPYPMSPVLAQSESTLEDNEAEEAWITTAQGRFRFTVEIADEPMEHSRGLMFRKSMPANHGMLFDFGEPRIIEMWMENTLISLDMIFIDEKGVVSSIAHRTEPLSRKIIASEVPVPFVLEINGGMARLIGLKAGDRLEHRFFSAE